jgi:hypothetical protein
MEIIQKKNGNTHTFTFKEDIFNFAYKDKSGSGDTDINYADFPKKSAIKIEQNEWLRNVGLLWCVLGVFQVGYALYLNESPSGPGWFFLGLMCLAWYRFSKVTYSVFQTEIGNVFIIHDKNHSKIIDELIMRRKGQLLKWYGDINPQNAKQKEIEKFKWLTEQDVLSKEESESKIAQVELLHQDIPSSSIERLN